MAEEDLAEEDLAEEDLAEEDLAEEDLAEEDLAEEDLAEEDLADALAEGGLFHGEDELDSAEEVSRHPVGAADIDFVFPSVLDVENARVPGVLRGVNSVVWLTDEVVS